MRKLSLILAVLVVFASAAVAAEKKIKLAWDPYTGETATIVDSVLIYMKAVPGGFYDYEHPAATVSQTVDAGGKSTPSQVEITVPVTEGQVTQVRFVARGANEYGQSEDSNESDIVTFNLTPLAAVSDLTAVYNKNTKTIDFAWTQSDPERVKSWRLYQSDTPGGPYTEIDNIVWDGATTTLTSSQSIVPTAGEEKTYHFVVVAFGDNSLNSSNSNEVTVAIDRRPAPKVINLRVTVQ